jgi:hypothetical protein
MHNNILRLLGNLIPRVCNQLPLRSQTGKSARTGGPEPGVQGEVAGLGFGKQIKGGFQGRWLSVTSI